MLIPHMLQQTILNGMSEAFFFRAELNAARADWVPGEVYECN